MKKYSHIIKRVVTEKTALLESRQVYAFEVPTTSNKHQVAEAIRMLYGQKPNAVRMVMRTGQRRRVGKLRQEKQMPTRKIAYVSVTKPIEELVKSA
ncbi:MAG TPA: 50S ribosomal protein L23 [Candidatus Woesebacteria bacterium]|nr:50S ribosomal protein L23 [Candidatus Woesebacteria bacterium]HNS94692.1 50S ribosomal protein L23 [Candidatus Woesebacteria bacterium]